jgi:hypothetical protein
MKRFWTDRYLHGKEGVAGSSPAEGFRNRAVARFARFRSGSDDHFPAQEKRSPVRVGQAVFADLAAIRCLSGAARSSGACLSRGIRWAPLGWVATGWLRSSAGSAHPRAYRTFRLDIGPTCSRPRAVAVAPIDGSRFNETVQRAGPWTARTFNVWSTAPGADGTVRASRLGRIRRARRDSLRGSGGHRRQPWGTSQTRQRGGHARRTRFAPAGAGRSQLQIPSPRLEGPANCSRRSSGAVLGVHSRGANRRLVSKAVHRGYSAISANLRPPGSCTLPSSCSPRPPDR